MRKWTYHYGQIMEVELQQDVNGWITGFTPIKCACGGVVFTLPIDLDATKFFDTVEEAIEGWTDKFNQMIGDKIIVLKWLKGETSRIQQETDLIQTKVSTLAKEAIR